MKATLVALPLVAGAGVSPLQEAFQNMLTEVAESTGASLSLGWTGANESFTVVAGNVTNPGKTSRALRPEDTFNYGSGTKSIIAAAVMRLADAGKVKLDDKVSTYVNPYLKRNNGTTLEELWGANMTDATVLQLIRMEAGIPDFEFSKETHDSIDSEALMSHGKVYPPYAWMRAAADQPAACAPGECSMYSSTGYEVAGLLLAAVQNPDGDYTDLNFQAAISDDPSRYPSMALPVTGQCKDTFSVAGFASGGFGTAAIYEQHPTIMGWACGGHSSTTQDLSRFFYDLLDTSSPTPIVSDAARKEMLNIKQLNSGYFKIYYGAGLMTESVLRVSDTAWAPTNALPDDWGFLIGHMGSTFGYHSTNGYMPRAKAAISITTNSDKGQKAPGEAACRATVIAAKLLENTTLSANCDPSSWGTRRRRTRMRAAAAEESVVV